MCKNDPQINDKACVDPRAKLGKNVKVGPFAIIEKDCQIGDGTVISPHAIIKKYTTIGPSCFIGEGSIIGTNPQVVGFENTESYTIIKDGSVLREYVTVHRSTKKGESTVVGEECMLMVGVHIAHDVQLGKKVVIANFTQIAGHALIGDNAFISTGCAVHQNTRVGRVAIVGGQTLITRDVLPFSMVEGYYPRFYGLNTVGLKRQNFDLEKRTIIKKYFLICKEKGLQEIKKQDKELHPLEQEILDFIKSTKKGIILNTKLLKE